MSSGFEVKKRVHPPSNENPGYAYVWTRPFLAQKFCYGRSRPTTVTLLKLCIFDSLAGATWLPVLRALLLQLMMTIVALLLPSSKSLYFTHYPAFACLSDCLYISPSVCWQPYLRKLLKLFGDAEIINNATVIIISCSSRARRIGKLCGDI